MAAREFRSRPGLFYREDMKQNWSNMDKGYYDQFGFEIIRGQRYKLYWHDNYITETLSIGAAKEISKVLINDKIMHAQVQLIKKRKRVA